jgi:hypothetical protein
MEPGAYTHERGGYARIEDRVPVTDPSHEIRSRREQST